MIPFLEKMSFFFYDFLDILEKLYHRNIIILSFKTNGLVEKSTLWIVMIIH